MKTPPKAFIVLLVVGIVCVTLYHSIAIAIRIQTLEKIGESELHHSSNQTTDYHKISLSDLTQSKSITCSQLTFPIHNQIIDDSLNTTVPSRRPVPYHIPPIIHQTSKTRCVTKPFEEGVNAWKSFGWKYYFHDETAMSKLVNSGFREFPSLPLFFNNCLTKGAMKADIWRLLVLWEYGGIYSDLDSRPNNFRANTIRPNDDAVFVVDHDGTVSFHFMAFAPRHPLLLMTLYAIMGSLIQVKDTGRLNPVKVTGPRSLRSAIYHFLAMHKSNQKMLWGKDEGTNFGSGRYVGLGGKTIRILDNGNDQDHWIVRELMGPTKKKEEYIWMNMSHFTDTMREPSMRTCVEAIMELK